jgi:cell wall-associated NlpC family hydrolase
MNQTRSLPDILQIVTPLIGLPYEHFQLPGPFGASNACWGLVRHLLKEGFGFDLATDATSAAERFAEVWYRGDSRDPWEVLQRWDGLVLATRGTLSDHVGLIVEPTTMVHVRQRVGVCVEPIQRWKPKLVQIVRLRMAW